jgi:hypothetical protein
MKYLPIKDFRSLGLLQEVNRQFFHPRGLALEIMLDETSPDVISGIQDYRDDPEGLCFGDDIIESLDGVIKEGMVERMLEDKREARTKLFGGPIQPMGKVK